MKFLKEDIKNKQFKQLYLLCGEESYLKRTYKNELKKAIAGEEDTMNYSYFEGKSIDWNAVTDLADTLPFFAERRLIVIENSGLFKTQSSLPDYLKKMPGTTYMVFVEAEVDKRNRLYKTVKEIGRIVELDAQEEGILIRWIAGRIKKENKQVTEKTVRLFLSKTGTAMENIEQELEKLFCYTLGSGIITEEDVEAVCTVSVKNKIFEMIHAIAEKRRKDALDLYYDLLFLREAPMRILYLLNRQFQIMLQIKELLENGFEKKLLAGKVGISPYFVSRYIAEADHFSKANLRRAVEECAEFEEAVKTGRMNEKMGVELFIVKYSS